MNTASQLNTNVGAQTPDVNTTKSYIVGRYTEMGQVK